MKISKKLEPLLAGLFASIIITLILAATIYWIPLQLGISVNKDYFYQLMWFDSWI